MTADQTHEFRVTGIDGSVDEYIAIAGESLLSTESKHWQTYIDRIGSENMRCVFDGKTIVGGLGIYRMGQWFGGRVIRSAGISGVAIQPSHRGSGAAAHMLQEMTRELYEEGTPLSSLYASTQRLYRRCGYGTAGTQTQYSIATDALATCRIERTRALPIHRFDDPPLEPLQYADDCRARRSSGLLKRTDGLWRRLLDPYDGRGSITYLIGDERKPEGFVILRPGVRDRGAPQPLVSTDLVANTQESLGRLVTLLHDHRSMCDYFHWYGRPNDPLNFFSDRPLDNVLQQHRWMLRIVNLNKAISERGFHPAANGELHFDIVDPLISENSGRWRILVGDGNAAVQRGGDGALRMSIDALASLYSGYLTPDELIRVGELTITGEESVVRRQLELAECSFVGPTPWLPELF